MEQSFQAEAAVGAGRGALVVSCAGAFWLSWGLSHARAFVGLVGPAFGCLTLLLLVGSIFTIRQGRLLRKKYSPIPASVRRAMWRSFAVVVALEVAGILLALIIASRLHRPDLGADWFALVVGLHFLPLARTFHAPILGLFGALIVLWSLLCWAVFRGDLLLIAVAAGTGVLLWMMSISAIVRGWQIAQSLSVRQDTSESLA